jgi:hypothetical protein
MMFIPWFEIRNIAGDTTHIAALAVTVINDDGGYREIVVQGREKPINTLSSVDQIFERMGDAIEGARNAELEALYPPQTLDAKGTWDHPQAQENAVPERDTSGDRPVEPLPNWAQDWIERRESS